MNKLKNVEINVKYVQDSTDPDIGYIEGYASTWDRIPDVCGDIVAKGAFTKSLDLYKSSGSVIPLLWAHKMDDLQSFVGSCEADEDEKGLHFIAKFDDNPEAQRLRQLYKDGRLSKFSFAYDTIDSATVKLENGIYANELRELDIFEISCVLVPANKFAEIIEVKDGNTLAEKSQDEDVQKLVENAMTLLKPFMLELFINLAGNTTVDTSGSENINKDNTKGAEPNVKDQVDINEKQNELLKLIDKL